MLAIYEYIYYNNSCVKEKAPLAQLAEHLTLNQGVQGSNPWRRILKHCFYDIRSWGRCFFISFLNICLFL